MMVGERPQDRTQSTAHERRCHVQGVDAAPDFLGRCKDDALTHHLIGLYGGVDEDGQYDESDQ